MSLKITGPKDALAALRQEFLADQEGAQLTISEPKPAEERASEASEDVVVGQPWEVAEAVWVILITFPVSVAGEIAASQIDKHIIRRVEERVREWLRKRPDAAQIQIQESPATTEPDTPEGQPRG